MNVFREIETKWQKKWDEAKLFEAEVDRSRPKVFITFCFPYVNGNLHVGHAFTSLRNDIYARFKRAQGYNVLFPWAWHWTGEPIAGMAKRIKAGDEVMINLLKRIEKVSDEEIVKFTDPLYIATYFTNESRKAIKGLGYSIDWRREFNTTSHNRGFSAYVTWQYLKLKEMGYVTKGTHPVVWCPKDLSPTGDHDRLQGEGVSPEEITLIKFELEDVYLVAATLRPETLFGITNIWIDPNAIMVKAIVNGEKWIVNKETVEKLRAQDFSVEILESFKGEELIGKYAKAPIVEKKVIILPAFFIDPHIGTGVVYSVPSHAPYDYAGLKFLKKNREILRKYGISEDIIEKIEPINIIKTKGLGEHPAASIIENMKIEGVDDPKLEEATQKIYLEEFNKGIMDKGTQEFEGMKVSEARFKIFEKLKARGLATKIYDLLTPVVCRCGTRCIVSILKDQWFLKYSDPEWKERVRQALYSMKIFPEDARNWFLNTVNWLEDKACARKSGLGTPLPWDKEWIVETLSDSTIYMPYYVIAKYVNAGIIKPENLTEEFFDYVLLGKRDQREVSEKCGVSISLLDKIREEFLYWYPVDLRTSAKELIPNHLTFYIFHHTALFPKELWPKMIAVNGMINIEGKKLSKSKGIVIAIKEALEEFGADPLRLYLSSLAEGMEDADWTNKGIQETISNLQAFYNFALKIIEMEDKDEKTAMDSWIRSSFNKRLKATTDYLEDLRLRSAVVQAFYGVWNDIKWYLRRSENPNPRLLKEILKNWLILLMPFIPHICEEIWERMGNKGFISAQAWPTYNEASIDLLAEAREILLTRMYEDISNIKRTKQNIAKVFVYLPSRKKYEVLKKINELANSKVQRKEIMKKIMEELKDTYDEKTAVKLSNDIYEHYFKLEETLRKTINDANKIDAEVANELKRLMSKDSIECQIYEEENVKYDPLSKANKALPFKLGFYLE